MSEARDLIRELAETVHQTGGIRDHVDTTQHDGWVVNGIETCRDPLCVEALAWLAASERPPVDPLRAALIRRLAERVHGDESHAGSSFADCPHDPCSEVRAALASPAAPRDDFDHAVERDEHGVSCCEGHAALEAAPRPEGLRELVWAAQHEVSCGDGDPHPWTDHLPWDSPEDEAAAIEEADAIIAAIRPAAPRPEGLDVREMSRFLQTAWTEADHATDGQPVTAFYDDLARRVVSAFLPPEGLDVERLRAAISEAQMNLWGRFPGGFSHDDLSAEAAHIYGLSDTGDTPDGAS